MTGHRTSISVRQLAKCLSEDPTQFDTFRRYWNDPEFRNQHDADRQSWRDRTNALIDDGMRRAREKRESGL